MKINIYKIFIYIGLFSINYNYGMESFNLNNSMERETFNFFISFLGDMIYKINRKNKFKKVEVEKIENISFYKVPLDKKNEKFVYIPKFGETLNIEKFSNKKIFEIYKGFTILANDNENLKINEDNQSEIFKYLLDNNINSLNDNIAIDKGMMKVFRLNESKDIYIRDISKSIRNLFTELNFGILLSKRKSLEDAISVTLDNLKIFDKELLKKVQAQLLEMKDSGKAGTDDYKNLLKFYKENVDYYNKINEEGRFFKEELEFNKEIVSIEGKDNSYNELEKKYQKKVVFTNSKEGQEDLKNQDEKIKTKRIEDINQKIKTQLTIEYNEGLAEIKKQPDSLLQEMINAEKEKKLIKSGDKLAIFKNEFNKFNEKKLDNDKETDFETMLKKEKEEKALEDAKKKINELEIGNKKKSKNKK